MHTEAADRLDPCMYLWRRLKYLVCAICAIGAIYARPSTTLVPLIMTCESVQLEYLSYCDRLRLRATWVLASFLRLLDDGRNSRVEADPDSG